MKLKACDIVYNFVFITLSLLSFELISLITTNEVKEYIGLSELYIELITLIDDFLYTATNNFS